MFDKSEHYTVVKKVSQTVTNADQADLATDFPLLQRGLRKGKIGTIFQRDFGSQHIYPTNQYPKAPNGGTITMLTPLDDLYDAKTGKRHNIHIGYTANNIFRVNVDANDGESATPNWQDLTRVLRGTVANYSPTSITLTASTITENLSTVETVSDDECNGWVLYNKTLAEYSKFVTNVVNNGSGLCRVTVANHGLIDNMVVFIEGVQGATGANGAWLVDVINANTFDLVGSTFGGSYTGGGRVTRLGQTLLIVTDTINLGSTVEFVVAAEMARDPEVLHVAGDIVYLIRSRAWYERLASENVNVIGNSFGTINNIAMIDNEPQSKRTLYINSVIGGENPLRIQYHGQRGRFYTSYDTALITLPAGWYLEEATHPIFYDKFGTLENPLMGVARTIVRNSGVPSVTSTIQQHSAWLGIQASTGNVGYTIYRGSDGGKLKYIRGYIILVFDGYQRSGPVVEFFTSTDGEFAPKIDFQFDIAPAKMNQHITGMEIYAQLITDVEYGSSVNNLNERNFSDADVQLVKTIYFDRVNDSRGGGVVVNMTSGSLVDSTCYLLWTLSPLQGDWEVQWYNLRIPRRFVGDINISLPFIQSTITGNPSIIDNLNHAVVKTRQPVKPIFATRAGDVNGAMVVIALDDSTLACSVVGGNGVVWDDAFPDVLVSQTGSRLRIPLQSKGQMLGIEYISVLYPGQRPSQAILVLKRHEKELVDLVNGNYVYPADVSSGKSIVRHPFGVVWAGEGGIYEFDSSGQERVINMATLNEYNGMLMCDDGITPITTSAYRSAVVGGYIPLTRQVILQVQQNKQSGSGSEYVCKLYNIDTKDWAPDRILGDVSGGRAISFIATRNDKLVNLSISAGVIKYPVVGKFKDEILYDGTGGVGYPAEQVINIGQLYSYDPLNILKWFATDYRGQVVSDGLPVFTTYFYANNETTPFDSHTQSINGSEHEIQIKNRGGVRRLRVKHELTAANALLTGEFEINTLTIGFEPDKRSGLK